MFTAWSKNFPTTTIQRNLFYKMPRYRNNLARLRSVDYGNPKSSVRCTDSILNPNFSP